MAIEMVSKAWQKVFQKTIKNCFKQAWSALTGYDEEDELLLIQWLARKSEEVDEEDIPLSTWLSRNSCEIKSLSPKILDCFIEVDNKVLTSQMPTEQEIIQQIEDMEQVESENDEEEVDLGEIPPSCEEAINGIKTVKRALEVSKEL